MESLNETPRVLRHQDWQDPIRRTLLHLTKGRQVILSSRPQAFNGNEGVSGESQGDNTESTSLCITRDARVPRELGARLRPEGPKRSK